MGDFSAAWLALREPVDHASRSAALAADLVAALPAGGRVLDLGCGTGSNWRYLRALAEDPQPASNARFAWTLVDREQALLDLVPAAPDVTVLARDLTALDDRLFEGCVLVTASALLDLVSAEWLRGLAERCRAQRAAVLFALTYDGRFTCEPPEPEDAWVRELVNRHQATDKGFGPALGPAAAAAAADSYRRLGFAVRTAASDWRLTPASAPAALQRELVAGWAEAAIDLDPSRADEIRSWEQRRLDHVAAGRSILTVGHQDLSAVPPPVVR